MKGSSARTSFRSRGGCQSQNSASATSNSSSMECWEATAIHADDDVGGTSTTFTEAMSERFGAGLALTCLRKALGDLQCKRGHD